MNKLIIKSNYIEDIGAEEIGQMLPFLKNLIGF